MSNENKLPIILPWDLSEISEISNISKVEIKTVELTAVDLEQILREPFFDSRFLQKTED